ncbi:ABC transporter permease subunit [Fictibacillus nanhaiensis]|uniref:ABC transporter permease n=1 Tax=Fictibacillus nanhaiensis TaxID=742169 RepID=UPI001C93B2BD|nr:ABC transporter permease subunit [Fictibacillus nanhaiensis]MBY6037158.1 ABC transporter permease subunit [Fictibacillus nanhaiensis]
MWSHFKQEKKAMLSLLFLILLLILSIGNTFLYDGEIRRVSLLFDEGAQVQAPPFAPSLEFPFGTDRKGYDLLHLIIEGAKWTIGASVLITLLRIISGLFIGILIGRMPHKLFKFIESFFDSFTVVPMTMIAYFLLMNVLVFANGTVPDPFYQRVAFEIIILTLLAVPTLAFYMSNEIRLILSEEYVTASRILGGSKKHILRKHVSVHMIPVVMILFMQQFVQVLVILVHLGVLNVFFGGTIVFFQGDVDSVTHEWTGLLGLYYQSIMGHPWIPLVPIIFFTLTIISSNFILVGIERAYEKEKVKFKSLPKNSEFPMETMKNKSKEKRFTFISSKYSKDKPI